MKDYPEWKHLRKEVDSNNPFCALYFYETGESFYLEPVFYTQLMGFKDHFPDKYHLIINRMATKPSPARFSSMGSSISNLCVGCSPFAVSNL